MKDSHLLRSIFPLIVLFFGLAAVAQQIQLPGKDIPKWIDPLPLLSVQGGPINTVVAGTDEIELHMREFKASVMPSTFRPATGTYTGTWVWGYIPGANPPNATQGTYLGPLIVATRNVPTQVRFVNDLGTTATTNILPFKYGSDQTLHWADPLNDDMNMCNHIGGVPTGECAEHYSGPIPAVPHLHGGEVPPVIDGGPDAWFTSDGKYHGHGYYTRPGSSSNGNEAVFRYPNTQEAAPIWFHDHALGLTRLNVYAGLAGAYLIQDPNLALPSDLNDPTKIIPLIIQDRIFDTNGQLLFPNDGVNPEHPFWVPEFIGDTILVNGKVWPYLQVAPGRYRFVFLNGSNARTYEMFLTDFARSRNGPPIWQIGTDGGYLNSPVKIDANAKPGHLKHLTLMPGERADVIIDFSHQQGATLLLKNVAKAPFPSGSAPYGNSVGNILQIRVTCTTDCPPTISYDPATDTTPLRSMVKLVDASTGTLKVTPQKIRQLTLNEVQGQDGPLEVMVNNSSYDGIREDGSVRNDFTPVTVNGLTNYYSEVPNEGDTEIWEIVNLTMDAHPIHTHLTQFQLLNRQRFDKSNYIDAYNAAFPGGAAVPEYGPPLDYNTGNPRALGGNPDVTPFLRNAPMPPEPNEAGWKDTVMAPPGQVTRFVVRYAPTDTPAGVSGVFPFDPNSGGHGYVWHCHIIDHEDNEMMRPLAVQPKSVTRTYIDY